MILPVNTDYRNFQPFFCLYIVYILFIVCIIIWDKIGIPVSVLELCEIDHWLSVDLSKKVCFVLILAWQQRKQWKPCSSTAGRRSRHWGREKEKPTSVDCSGMFCKLGQERRQATITRQDWWYSSSLHIKRFFFLPIIPTQFHRPIFNLLFNF